MSCCFPVANRSNTSCVDIKFALAKIEDTLKHVLPFNDFHHFYRAKSFIESNNFYAAVMALNRIRKPTYNASQLIVSSLYVKGVILAYEDQFNTALELLKETLKYKGSGEKDTKLVTDINKAIDIIEIQNKADTLYSQVKQDETTFEEICKVALTHAREYLKASKKLIKT